MSKIKIFVLFFACLSSGNIKASPIYEFEYGEPNLDGSSPRRHLCHLIAPVIRRHSIGTYIPSLPTPPTPAVPIQPHSNSPTLTRRSKSTQPD